MHLWTTSSVAWPYAPWKSDVCREQASTSISSPLYFSFKDYCWWFEQDLSDPETKQFISSQYNRPWVCMSFWISWTWNYPYMVCCNVHAWTVLLDMLEEVQWASLISALWKSGSDSKQERSWKNSFPRKLHWGENQPNLNMILFSNVVKGILIWSHHHINILTTICLK